MAEQTTSIRQITIRRIIDTPTFLGLSLAFLLMLGAIVLTGAPTAYFDIKSVMIVLGGTLGVTIASFNFPDLSAGMGGLRQAFGRSHPSLQDTANQALDLAVMARQRGLLEVQDAIDLLDHNPTLQKGLQLAVDGMEESDIVEIVGRDVERQRLERERAVAVLHRAADIAPGMGLIGTLIGLVQMLTRLDDPSSIGPAMAIALLTTFYGIILANMVFIPIASKLERADENHDMLNRLSIVASLSIQRLENPRRLEMLINAMLPPREQVRYFE